MAVSPHPSVKPSKPSKPPEAHQREGESGQEGIHYGARHTLHHHNPNKSEFPDCHGGFAKAGDKE